MKKVDWILCSLLLILGFAGALRADVESAMFKGEITEISDGMRSFRLQAVGREEHEIWLIPETSFRGLSSLAEVAVGDEVSVAAQQNPATGQWEADVVELEKVVIREPKEDVPVHHEIIEETQKRTEAAEEAAPELGIGQH